MIVKRYVVKDMPEALTKIRQELGVEAVILSSKKIKQKRFLGFFHVNQLEVVAAVNDGEPIVPTKNPTETKKTYATKMVNRMIESKPTAIKQESQISTGQSMDVLKEVQELRGVLIKFLNHSPEILPESLQKIRTDLMENDISPELAEKLIVSILKENGEILSASEQEFRHILTNLISKEITETLLPTPISPSSKIVAFIGPTGVGKTTTIAKIAAEELLKNKRKVGFITTDTFRIAAVEQLKTYASILQIPVEVVFSTDEIEQALDKLKDRDLILIDTAGRNYSDKVLVDQLNELLHATQPDETCLVLSLTTKSTDLEKIVGNFLDVNVDKFIFTKLDETNSYGAVYNLPYHYQKPLAYLTMGQNVPDDIEVASPDRIAKLVMGEKKYV